MTSRFYFNIVKATGTIHDLEGSELDSLDRARAEAIKDARHLMSLAILDGNDISGRQIEICNEAGEVLLRVPFSDALQPGD